MESFAKEIAEGRRFGFGRNWESFLGTIDDDRIGRAMQSLRDLLRVEDLEGKTFLDIGCGSGLFSLAAARLSATVLSIDIDPDSVACAVALRAKYGLTVGRWAIERLSVLDEESMARIGKFDVVYSWGVLHHTGKMWSAVDIACRSVAASGRFAVALYNDQGRRSRMWLEVKRAYCRGPAGRTAVTAVFLPVFAVWHVAEGVRRGRGPVAEWRAYRANRGMSRYHDWIDWLGGLPFEVASPGAVVSYLLARGFSLEHMGTTSGLGNNEFVFLRGDSSGAPRTA